MKDQVLRRSVLVLLIVVLLLIIAKLICSIFSSPAPQPDFALRISGDPAGIIRQDDNIIITLGGEYRLSGETAQGSVVVDAGDSAVTLRLDGIQMVNNFGAVIYFRSSGESQIILETGSSNSLVDSIIESPEADAAIYSVASLRLSGDGQLAISGRAQEGIASDGDVIIDSGSYTIYAEDDGINASTDGDSTVIINGGELNIYSHGDAIDSNGDIIINDGEIYAYADLQDGSDGLDFDGEFTIHGGRIIATGYGHADPPSDQSTQRFIIYSNDLVLPRDTTYRVFLADDEITSFIAPKELRYILYSSPDLQPGLDYDLREVFE